MNGSEFQIVCIFKSNCESFLINKKTLVKHPFYFHFLEVKYEAHRIIGRTKLNNSNIYKDAGICPYAK